MSSNQSVSGWECSFCTFLNCYTNVTCAACTLPNPNTAGLPNIDALYEFATESVMGERLWRCRVCTYTNGLDKKKCQMCGLPNKYNIKDILNRYNVTRMQHQKQISVEEYQTKLIVTGYFRNIEKLLNTNTIIPSGVIQLCFMFYVNIPWDCIVKILSTNIKLHSITQPGQPLQTERNLLRKLQKIAEYLLNEQDEKYKTLYLHNTYFRYEILQYEGTLVFLYNLGYVLDSQTNDKLICQHFKVNIVASCIECLTQKCKKLKMEIAFPSINVPVNPNRWTCPSCTFVNNHSISRCELCQLGNCPQTIKNRPIPFENPATIEDFRDVASDILHYHYAPLEGFRNLRSLTKNLRKDDDRYRKLHLTWQKVSERFNQEDVLNFLRLLGFKSGDALGLILVCQHKPPQNLVDDAVAIIEQYQSKLQILNKYHSDDINDREIRLDTIIKHATNPDQRNYDIMEILVMTHKMFTTSMQLMKGLRNRFMVYVRIPDDDKLNKQEFSITHKRIHLKTTKILRNWIRYYWKEDFHQDEQLQNELNDWLENMLIYAEINEQNINTNNCDWVVKLYQTIKRDITRSKNEYKSRDSDSEQKNVNNDNYDMPDMDKKELRVLTNCSGEELADQITLMEWEIFHKIKVREWLNCMDKQDKDNLAVVMERHKHLKYFVTSKILGANSLQNRRRMIRRFIRVGEQLKDTQNYQSLSAIFAALHSVAIQRLELAWLCVSERWKSKYDDWIKYLVADNLRGLIRSANGYKPCIPRIDMLMNYFSMDEPIEKSEIDIKRYIVFVDRIHRIQQYQNMRYDTLIKPNKMLQRLLLSEFNGCKDVSLRDVLECSIKMGKKDEHDSKHFNSFM